MSNFLFSEQYNDLKPLTKRTFKGRYFVRRSDYEYENSTFKFRISFYKNYAGTIELPSFTYTTPSTVITKYWPSAPNRIGHRYTTFSLDNIIIPGEAKCVKIEALLDGKVCLDSIIFEINKVQDPR